MTQGVASCGGVKETEQLIKTNNHPSCNLGLIIHANVPEERPSIEAIGAVFAPIDFALDFAHFAP